jgi:hypothetical protein
MATKTQVDSEALLIYSYGSPTEKMERAAKLLNACITVAQESNVPSPILLAAQPGPKYPGVTATLPRFFSFLLFGSVLTTSYM